MSLKNDAIPSSAAFDVIKASIGENEQEKQQAIKMGNGIFAFTIKNGQTTDSWYIDLKSKGEVGKGLAPQGQKPTVTISVSDADFAALIDGKANPQKLFMGGKLKVKGDVMKATKLDPILKRAKSAGAKL